MGSYSYAKAMDGYSRQLAAAYLVSLEFGVYFESCSFTSHFTEERLYQNFRRLKTSEAQRMIFIIQNAARDLLGDDDTQDLRCALHGKAREDGAYLLYFETGIEDVMVVIPERGKFRLETKKILQGA